MPKVLIVEDNIMLADILEDTLVLGGYEICGVAHNVAAALELADLHQPDIGIFDFRLGRGEYGSSIRTQLKNKSDMTILYVSADDLGSTLTRADGEAYIQKPYSMNDLLLAVHIAHEIKRNGDFFPAFCPKTFHRLKDTLPPSRRAA